MKRKFILIVVALVSTCLADTPEEQHWKQLITAGNRAMENRQYSEAEKSFTEGVTVAASIGPNDARIASSLIFLAQALNAQSKKDAAENAARRSVAAMDNALAHLKPKTAEQEFYTNDTSAKLFDHAGDIFAANQKDPEAETLYRRVIGIREKAAGEKKPQNNEDWLRQMTQVLSQTPGTAAEAEEKLGNFYFRQKRFSDAASLYGRAAASREADSIGDKRYVPRDVGNQAICLAVQGKNSEAEKLFLRALARFEELNGAESPEAARLMQNYALLLKKLDRNEEARAMSDKAKSILEKAELNHPVGDKALGH